MNTYIIYWNDGSYEHITGSNFIIAFINHGYTMIDYQSLLCWEKI